MIEEDLLQAIAATPDDVGPRLVYADHLIANGDRRGELVAVQCLRDQRPGDVALARRERELALEVSRSIIGSRTALELHWRYGFVDEVSVSRYPNAKELAACIGPAFRWTRTVRARDPVYRGGLELGPVFGNTVTRLVLGGRSQVGRDQIERMLAEFPRVTELVIVEPYDLGFDRANLASLDITTRYLQVFEQLGTWPLTRLRLDLTVETPIARITSILEKFPGLRDLGVSGNIALDDVIAALATSPLLATLETLALGALDDRALGVLRDNAAKFAHVRLDVAPSASMVLGRPIEAVASYRASVRAMPSDLRCGIALGNLLLSLGRTTEAIAAFDDVATSELPGAGDGWYGRHRALLATGQVEGAVVALAAAVDAEFRDDRAWCLELADLLDRLGRSAEASAARERARWK